MLQSMSRKDDCWGNSVPESLFSTLEFEEPDSATWRHLSDEDPEIFTFIESYYNQTSLHSHKRY